MINIYGLIQMIKLFMKKKKIRISTVLLLVLLFVLLCVAGALDASAGGFGLDAVSVCVDDALDALCDLTGENASEAVINEVFERFCVGK